MCGICGNISIGKRTVKNIKNIEKMLDVQNHRGPDDRGICCFRYDGQEVFSGMRTSDFSQDGSFDGIIGFNRLSILDLSQNGHQPMLSLDEKIILAFNGEIYNAFDFTEELKNKGYVFRSGTDTEVILNLYIEYGFDKMIKLLNGMFAIAIVDLRKSEVYLARDRFGIKPFYYSIYNDKLTFASEIKCFLCDDEFEPQLNTDTLYETMIYSGTNNITLMNEVQSLYPGEILKYSYKGEVSKYKFFDINDINKNNKIKSKEYLEELEYLLRKAVKRQMISDVKVGCQLSGGIDSTLVTTFASEIEKSPLKDTVSIVFDNDNKSYSEEEYMDIVQKKLQLKQHKYILNTEYVKDNLERTIWHLDTIANTPNSVGIMLLSEEAKKNVTVLLSGEGADEVFGGYWQFTRAAFFEKLVKCDSYDIISKLSNKKAIRNQIDKMRKGYDYYVATTHGFLEKDALQELFSNDSEFENKYWAEIDKRQDLFNKFSGDEFEKHIKYKIVTNLPDLLVRQDKMSMSASIENRVPFLDNDVVDFALTLPKNVLLHWDIKQLLKGKYPVEGKYALKKISENIYGKEFTYRRKRGFDLPLANFLDNKDFKNYFHDELIINMEKRNVLNAKYVKELYKNIETINNTEAQVLWKAINFELWCSLFLDKRGLINE